jgi:Transposase
MSAGKDGAHQTPPASTSAVVNRPEFRAHFPSWEGCHDARQVRPRVEGQGDPAGPQHANDYASEWAAITAVAGRLGMSGETLRKWIHQAEVDAGQVPGVSSEAVQEVRELRRKNRELEQRLPAPVRIRWRGAGA